MNTTETPIITQGDRIVVRNVPQDNYYAFLYDGFGTVDYGIGMNTIEDKVCFYMGYTPYKHNGSFSISGSGNTCPKDKLRFLKYDDAPFWRFKDNVWKAHNSETYYEKVNFWEVDYKDLK